MKQKFLIYFSPINFFIFISIQIELKHKIEYPNTTLVFEARS